MNNGKPPDFIEHYIRNSNPNAANPATSSASNTQQPRLEFPTHSSSSRSHPYRPQQKFQQPFTPPQQHRYINPVPRASSAAPWHPSPPVTVNNTNANHASTSSNNKFLSATPRNVRTSTPSLQRPSTANLASASISRSSTPKQKHQIMQIIKLEDDLAVRLPLIPLSDLERELADLLQANENDDDDSDLSADDITRKTLLKREFYELDSREAEIARETVDLKNALEEYNFEQRAQEKFLKILDMEEEFIPMTSALPPDVLVEKIIEENQRKVAECNHDHDEFERIHKLISDFDALPGTDPFVDENRPEFYEPKDVEDDYLSYEAYEPFIQSLGKLMGEHQNYLSELRENKIQKYGGVSRDWVLKQEKTERNTRKIHKDNKNREIYEKSFPDMRRAREEKERALRSEKRPNAKQEAAAAQAEVDERKKVFGSAIIPPMNRALFMSDQPRGRIIVNPIKESNENLTYFLQSWSLNEKSTFQRKFQQYGKNFPALAACIGSKSTSDCVRYFYLTKQHVKYKQLQKKPKRKKAGKQYKPTMIPTQGEIMIERIRAFPFMKTNKYIECLICEKQMTVFMVPKLVDGKRITGEYIETADDSLPICDGCNMHIRKAKAANFSKCPLRSCALGGRKKAKPSRTIPETANTLDLERRRFIIHHRKLHPEAVKCCGSCIRKIQNDFTDLVSGKLNDKIAEFNRHRKLKKQQKEKECIPIWDNEQILRLRQAILVFGIGNWYEVACRLNVSDKTPFYCWLKHKEMVESGEWEAYGVEAEPDIYDNDVFDEETAADYLNDLVLNNERENLPSMIRVKQEIVSPPTSPSIVKMETSELSYLPQQGTGHLTKRERQLMRHFYLEALAERQEQNLEIGEYVSDESEIPEDPAMESPLIHEPKAEEEDGSSDIQVLQVLPPQQHTPFGGSLTQGTPRANPPIPISTGATSPAPPTLMLNNQQQPFSFEGFLETQKKSLFASNATSSQNRMIDLLSLQPRNDGVSSSSSSITPIDQNTTIITTTTPAIYNFFNPDIARMHSSFSPTYPPEIKASLEAMISPRGGGGMASTIDPRLINFINFERSQSAEATALPPSASFLALATSRYENSPLANLITQQQSSGQGYRKPEITQQQQQQPAFYSPGATRKAQDLMQPETSQRYEEYPRKTATPDMKRKSGVETVCLPHAASSHRSMHIKPHPPPTSQSGPTPESITPLSNSKPSTPPQCASPAMAPIAPPQIGVQMSTAAMAPIGIASPILAAATSFVPPMYGINMATTALEHPKTLTPKLEIASENIHQPQTTVIEKISPLIPKIEENLPPTASTEPIPFQEIHIEVEQPKPLAAHFREHGSKNDLPDEAMYDISERISAYPEPTGVEMEGPYAIQKLGKLTSPASDSYVDRPIKKARRPFSTGVDPKLINDPENPPMDAYTSLDVDIPVRIGESAMSPCCEEDIHLLTLGAPTICGDKGNLLAPFDGVAPAHVREGYLHQKPLESTTPHHHETKSKPLDPVYFSDDDGPKSPDEIGTHNVAWLGDPLPKAPSSPRPENEFNPFEKLKFKKRKKLPVIVAGPGLDIENDNSTYNNEIFYPNLRLEAVYNEWERNDSMGFRPQQISAIMNPNLNCRNFDLTVPPRQSQKQPRKTKKRKHKETEGSKVVKFPPTSLMA